ncbi:MAG: 50S ribosomal protein L25 [bacterium]|nr:50S ribosomal protein L25 [bacterium]
MSETVLEVEIRKDTGKAFAKTIRRESKVPGVFYFQGKETLPLTFDAIALKQVIASKPALIMLNFDDGTQKEAVIREIQRNPVTEAIVHVDMMGIKRGQKLKATVPIVLVGEALGMKEGGIIEQLLKELDIECLPRNLPDKVVVDVTELEIGDSIHVSDLELEEIEIHTRENTAIASVIIPKVVVTAVEEEEEEGEEGEEVEGEEGEAAPADEDKGKEETSSEQ